MKIASWASFVICFLFIYLWRLHSTQPLDIPDQAEIKLTGRIIQQPYLKGSKQVINVNGFYIQTDPFPTYFYNQKIIVIGKVRKRMTNSYIYSFSLYHPQISVADQSRTLIDKINYKEILFLAKSHLEQRLEKILPEPQASLLTGILLGSKKTLTDEFTVNLRETGTMHVIVASGYNISVVAGFLAGSMLLFFHRRLTLLVVLLGIIAYTLMAGGEPPVVRAAIMGGLTYLAQFLGREKDAFRSLLFAAAVILLISPLTVFDIGFQLSFMATTGILLINPLLFGKLFDLPLLGQDLKVTLAAQAATLPILLFNFGKVSLLSPLINTLALPVTPLIMLLGAVTVALSLLNTFLGQMAAWIAWLPLTYFTKLINWFGPLASSTALQTKWNAWLTAAYYSVLIIWLWRKRRVYS